MLQSEIRPNEGIGLLELFSCPYLNSALAQALHHGRSALPDLLSQLLNLHPMANHLLLVLDQFEDLYTLCPEPQPRQQFIDVLLSLTPSRSILLAAITGALTRQ